MAGEVKLDLNQDYYKNLGLQPGATEKSIRERYKALVSEFHESKYIDRSSTEREFAEKRMKEINSAKGVLLDPEARKEYDNHLKAQSDLREKERAAKAAKGQQAKNNAGASNESHNANSGKGAAQGADFHSGTQGTSSNLYKQWGLGPNATADEIRKATESELNIHRKVDPSKLTPEQQAGRLRRMKEIEEASKEMLKKAPGMPVPVQAAAGNVAKTGVMGTLGRFGSWALKGMRASIPGIIIGTVAGMAYDAYTSSEAEAKPGTDSKSNSSIANPPTEHKVEPVPEQPEHKALREKNQLEADKKKLEAERAEFEAQKKAQQEAKGVSPTDGTGGAKSHDAVKGIAKGEDSVREVQKGDTLTSIADSRDADMKKARAQVREALGGNANNETVLNVLAIALAENNGKEKIHHIEVGDKLSISGDKIKQVVADLKEAGKLENGRLALGNETTLTEIFARAPNTPSNNPQVASAGK